MPRKTICVVLNSSYKDGGSSTYENAFEKFFKENFAKKYEVIFLFTGKRGNHSFYYKLNILRIIFIKIIMNNNIRFILKKIGLNQLGIEKKLKKLNVDLIIFTSPNLLSLGIYSIPFFSTVWDLGHRDLPNYPETSLNGNFENREEFYSKVLPKSSGIFVDSDKTANRVIDIYDIESKRVHILGLRWTLQYRNQKESKYLLLDHKSKFVVYPANFWFHKNHRFLVKVFNTKLIRESEIRLILTGIDKGSLDSVKNEVNKFGLSEKIIFAGQISIEELNYIYRNCLGVVFPSKLGPSNLPPLEALLFNKKAIVSEVHTSSEFDDNRILKLPIDNPLTWAQEILNLLSEDSEAVEEKIIKSTNIRELVDSALKQFFSDEYELDKKI